MGLLNVVWVREGGTQCGCTFQITPKTLWKTNAQSLPVLYNLFFMNSVTCGWFRWYEENVYIPRLNSTDKCPYTISYSIPSFDKNKHYKIIELINSHYWPGYVGCKDKYCVLLHRGPICTSLTRVVQLSISKIEPNKKCCLFWLASHK